MKSSMWWILGGFLLLSLVIFVGTSQFELPRESIPSSTSNGTTETKDESTNSSQSDDRLGEPSDSQENSSNESSNDDNCSLDGGRKWGHYGLENRGHLCISVIDIQRDGDHALLDLAVQKLNKQTDMKGYGSVNFEISIKDNRNNTYTGVWKIEQLHPIEFGGSKSFLRFVPPIDQLPSGFTWILQDLKIEMPQEAPVESVYFVTRGAAREATKFPHQNIAPPPLYTPDSKRLARYNKELKLNKHLTAKIEEIESSSDYDSITVGGYNIDLTEHHRWIIPVEVTNHDYNERNLTISFGAMDSNGVIQYVVRNCGCGGSVSGSSSKTFMVGFGGNRNQGWNPDKARFLIAYFQFGAPDTQGKRYAIRFLKIEP